MTRKLKHHRLLLRRLILVFAAFFCCRVIFFLFNINYFHSTGFSEVIVSFFAGFIFDTSAIVYTFALFILAHLIPFNFRNHKSYQLCLKIYFLVVTFACIFLNLIDTAYYPFGGRRSGAELFRMKNDILDQSFSYLSSYWYLALLLLAFVWMLNKLYPVLKDSSDEDTSDLIKQAVLIPVFAALCFIGARGGVNMKPVSAFDAARLADVRLLALTLNTPFQIIISVQQVGVEQKKFFPDETARKLFNPLHHSPSDIGTKPNIVLIIMESVGKEYVGYYNKGKGYTPFLDSLMKHSTVYMHAYANGKRSIEGIPSIIASMPSLMTDDYNNSIYQSNTIRGIGSYMQENGYSTSFYHGGKNGTMSFDNFVALTNSGKYYGMNEYPEKEKDFDGDWGIYDGPYLQYFANELNVKPQPFFSTVFTLSAHHPYNIPAGIKDRFEEGTLPIHKSIRYADYALWNFFEAAQKTNWYQNTIFIITADHSAENETAFFQSAQGNYEIPMLIFNPSNPKQEIVQHTVQHADILPMVLKLSSFPRPFFSFGNSDTLNTFAIQYFSRIYQLIQWPYVYQFDGDKTIGFYNIEQDSFMRKSINKQTDQKQHMDSVLKSVIQQYNDALIGNSAVLRN